MTQEKNPYFYVRESLEKHKLRVVMKSKGGDCAIGITIAQDKAGDLIGTYFSMERIGTDLIFRSGCAPGANK